MASFSTDPAAKVIVTNSVNHPGAVTFSIANIIVATLRETGVLQLRQLTENAGDKVALEALGVVFEAAATPGQFVVETTEI
jgi:hypothetical protein